jgi:hypothetical protein
MLDFDANKIITLTMSHMESIARISGSFSGVCMARIPAKSSKPGIALKSQLAIMILSMIASFFAINNSPKIIVHADTGVTAPTTFGVSLTADTTAQSVPPGDSISYVIHATNTGSQADIYAIDIKGFPAWGYQFPASLHIPAGQTQDFNFVVTTSINSLNGEADHATITAVSVGDNTVESTIEITTTVVYYEYWLPVIMKK